MRPSDFGAATAGLLAAVWVWAGLQKFGQDLPMQALGMIEIALGLGLLLPSLRQRLGLASGGLVLLFAGYTAANAVLGTGGASCGCFGEQSPGPVGHVLLLAGMAIASLLVLLCAREPGRR